MQRLIMLGLTLVLTLLVKAPMSMGDDSKPPTPAPNVEPAKPAAPANALHLKHCRLEYDETTRLASPLPSFLQDLLVDLGAKVKAGQVVGRLFDQEVRAELENLTMKAESDITISLAKTDLALAQTKLSKTESLEKRSFASNEVLLEDRYSVQRAQIALANAEFEKKLAKVDQRRLQGEVRARELVAPHDGVVVEILKNQGESLMTGDPIIRMVNADRLKVWGSVNVPDLWKLKIGQPVRVVPDIPGVDLEIEHEVFEGRLTFINNEINKETQTCQVLAIIENKDGLLKGGLVANMEIDIEKQPVLSKTNSSGPAPTSSIKGASIKPPKSASSSPASTPADLAKPKP